MTEEPAGAVLSPHPDDAVLSAWSVLRGSGDVRVVNVCTALPSPGTQGSFDVVLGVSDSRGLMATRVAEDVAALAAAGRTGTNLDFVDEQYRDGPLPADGLREAIAGAVDGVAWLCAPAAIGGHADHVAVRDVALAVGRDRGLPVSLYADVPYAIWAGWPHWVTGAPPRPYLVPEARWQPDLDALARAWPGIELAAEPIALAPDEWARKVAALEHYVSQFATLNGGPLDRLRVPEIIGFELRWSVRW